MNKLIPCKHCGVEVAKGAKNCPSCGGKLKMSFLLKAIIFIGCWAFFGAIITSG